MIGDNNFTTQLNFDTYMVGGFFKMSEPMIADMYQILTTPYTQTTFIIKGKSIMGHRNQIRNIALDTRNGKLYTFDNEANRIYRKNKNITYPWPPDILGYINWYRLDDGYVADYIKTLDNNTNKIPVNKISKKHIS